MDPVIQAAHECSSRYAQPTLSLCFKFTVLFVGGWKIDQAVPSHSHLCGQISIIPKPELRGFWGSSLIKPPFRVTSADVVIICPDLCGEYFINHEIRIPELANQDFMESIPPGLNLVAQSSPRVVEIAKLRFPPRKLPSRSTLPTLTNRNHHTSKYTKEIHTLHLEGHPS